VGAVSYFEDIVKRRDEALSQLSVAVRNGRISESNLDNIVQILHRIVEQEYAKILNMMDIVTSPEMDTASETNKLKTTNASLEASCNKANREIAALKSKLDQAEQNAEILRTRTRRRDRELHELKQRKWPVSRRE
jgi:chromosome segregation ATPase